MTSELIKYLNDISNPILALIGIITLFLLYRQVKIANKEAKQSNKLAKIQAYQMRYQLFLEMDKFLIEKPEYKLFISNKRVVEDFADYPLKINPLQKMAFIEMVLNMCQLTYYHYKDNVHDSQHSWTKELLQNPHIQEYWKSGYRCSYRDDFKKFVTQEIENSHYETKTHG